MQVWDGPYSFRCGIGSEGMCAYHGPHKPHPDDGRPCQLNQAGYCWIHGEYADRES